MISEVAEHGGICSVCKEPAPYLQECSECIEDELCEDCWDDHVLECICIQDDLEHTEVLRENGLDFGTDEIDDFKTEFEDY